MSLLGRLTDARLASLAVIVLGACAAAALAINAYGTWSDERERLSELEHRTALLEQRAEALSRRNNADGQETGDAGILVYGETPGLAVAELQRIVSTIARNAGAVVRSMDTPPGATVADAKTADGKLLQSVRLSAEIDVGEQALPDLLYAIETEKPLIVVDGLALTGDRRNVAGEATGWVGPAERQLMLRIDLSAFRAGTEE